MDAESRSQCRMRAYTILEGDTPVGLVVQIEIACESCGVVQLLLEGHHVRPVVEMLQEIIAREPEMTDPGRCEKTDRREWAFSPENN